MLCVGEGVAMLVMQQAGGGAARGVGTELGLVYRSEVWVGRLVLW